MLKTMKARDRGARWGRRALRLTAASLLGAVASVAALRLIPRSAHPLGPLTIAAEVAAGRGRSILEIPPFGNLSADTHSTPLVLKVTVQQLDPNALGSMLQGPVSRQHLTAQLEEGLRAAARAVAVVVEAS